MNVRAAVARKSKGGMHETVAVNPLASPDAKAKPASKKKAAKK